MKLLCAVMSKGRSKAILKNTLSWLRFTQYDVVVFVEPQDYEAYRDIGVPLENIGADDQGFNYVKAKIEEYATKNGYDLIFKLDDDVQGWYGTNRKKSNHPLDVFEKAIIDCLSAFNQWPNVKAIGFNYKHEMFEVKKWIAINARLQSCYIVRTGWFGKPDKEVPTEDFYTYTYIRANNGETLRYGLCGLMCDVGKMAGGYQSFDRQARTIAGLDEFIKLNPAMKFKKKPNSNWGIEPDLTGPFFGYKGL